LAPICIRYEIDSWGVGELWLEAERVLWHESPRPRPRSPHPGRGVTRLPLSPTIPGKAQQHRDVLAPILVERLRRFFAGRGGDFSDVELDLEDLTPFQRACADALRRVPAGEVVTYGELAELAGAPRAARAAGTFCAHNRHSIFIPCHRVVGANGLGGYGELGADYKRRLLALDGRRA
jgi:methylated-DNA-[protein]-cysteine S-methyltransferase